MRWQIVTNKEKLDEIYKQNLENDIIGKYVEKLMKPMETKKTDSGITEAFLLENGF